MIALIGKSFKTASVHASVSYHHTSKRGIATLDRVSLSTHGTSYKMANFLADLWESVFTPGPTPTLLIAANATFGALQLLLLALLAATWSVHFVVLSVLCAGLWYSINWFATELAAATAKEAEAERLRLRNSRNTRGADADRGEADDEGDDTEVEGGIGESIISLDDGGSQGAQASSSQVQLPSVSAPSAGQNASSSARLRKVEESDRSGDISTDSEWEKVDEKHS